MKKSRKTRSESIKIIKQHNTNLIEDKQQKKKKQSKTSKKISL